MRAKKLWRTNKTSWPRKHLAQDRLRQRDLRGKRAKVRTRAATTTFFTPSSNHTAIGAKHRITDTSGNRAKRNVHAIGIPTRTAAGFTPMLAGLGFRKSGSAGPRTITVAGRVCAASVGFGCRATNGRPLGSHGVRAMSTSAGRRCRRKRASIAAKAFTIGRTIITTSVRTNIALWQRANLEIGKWGAQLCRASATSPSSIRLRT